MAAGTTAFVASTLPIALLDIKIAEWGITEVILLGETHLASYRYLQQRHPAVVLRVLPSYFLLGTLYLMVFILKIKISRTRLVFFHECCCPVFDILTNFIRPTGDYYPQVSMNSFVLAKPEDVPKTKLQKIIRVLGFEGWFCYYRGDLDNNEGYFFVQTAKVYPAGIAIHTISESRTILRENFREPTLRDRKKKILILCGREVVDDLQLKKIYSQVIELAASEGFACYLKDHPAKHAQLNLIHKEAFKINPAIPLEFMEDDYVYIIGVASTALLHFNTRAISIIKLFPAGKEDEHKRRVLHLLDLPGGEEIQFPNDFFELKAILTRSSIT
jgi:hypothetical protein